MKSLVAFALLMLAISVAHADVPAGIYRLDDSIDDSACTAVAVTLDGVLMTALHCLRNCLRGQGRMESTSSPYIGLSELDVVTQPKQPATCPKLSIESLGVRGVTVLATGTSLIQYTPEFFITYPSYFADLRAHDFDAMNDDFALIQITTPTPNCGKLATKDIPPNAHLAALGFQQQENQPSVLLYNETPGFRYSSAEQSAYSQLTPTADFAKYVSQMFDHTDFIYSSAPIKEGQSGGPVINDQREIAGLVSGHSTSQASDGPGVSELFAVPLSHVMDKLPASLAEVYARKRRLPLYFLS